MIGRSVALALTILYKFYRTIKQPLGLILKNFPDLDLDLDPDLEIVFKIKIKIKIRIRIRIRKVFQDQTQRLLGRSIECV